MNEENDQYIDQMVPTDDKLSKVAKLASDFVAYDRKVKILEVELEMAKRELQRVGQEELPTALHDVGIQSFTMKNGLTVECEPVVYTSLRKDNIDEAEAWLDINGHSGMVTKTIVVGIPKIINAQVFSALLEFINNCGLKFKQDKRIHPQTLAKWGREMEEANEVIPDIFNVFRGYKTTVK